MMAVASSIDSNLLSETRWGWLKAELSIPGPVWYVLFHIGDVGEMFWAEWLADVTWADEDNTWSFWNTTGTTLTPNSRDGVARNSMAMWPGAGWDWVAYLRGL